MNNQLVSLRIAREKTMTMIGSLEEEINIFQIDIEKLTLKKDNIANIKLLQKPEVSLCPIDQKKKQNVAVAGVVSLMLGIFLAFFMEYWDKSSKQN